MGQGMHDSGVPYDASDLPFLKSSRRQNKWLIGVSGGADSVALLHLLHDAGFRRVIVCHLHHGLRGKESDGDACFVMELAKRLGYEAEIEQLNVMETVKESGESMETVARRARLSFFARVARRRRCKRLLLAHHADDQAETVLWNLARGAYGLRGMKEVTMFCIDGVELQVIRPLLAMRHADLAGWLKSKRRRWREDASNCLPIAIRNRLRNECLPLLQEITGRDPVLGLTRLAADFRESEEALREILSSHSILDPQGRIHLGALRELPVVLRRMAIFDFLGDDGIPDITRALVDEVLEMLEPGSAASVNLPGGGRLRRTGGRFWIDR